MHRRYDYVHKINFMYLYLKFHLVLTRYNVSAITLIKYSNPSICFFFKKKHSTSYSQFALNFNISNCTAFVFICFTVEV